MVAADAERLHHGLRAVVAGADADAVAAEDLGHVVRVHALERERHDAAAAGGIERAVDRHAGHLGEPLERVGA